jgi:hypothetical protein
LRASASALRWIAAGAVAAAVAAWAGSGGLRPLLESPETGIRRALDAAPAPGGAAPGPGGLRLDRLRLTDLVVAARGDLAEVKAVADAEGAVAWRGLEVSVSYVGAERLSVARCASAGWCVEGERLPRLAALVAVLLRRADAFDDGDADRYRPLVADDYRGPDGGKPELLRRLAADLSAAPRARLRPLAWQVRIERDVAQVGEDYEVAIGGAPPRRLRARLDLRDDGGRWRFTGGL